ncbi:MAG: fumarate hydratase, partial [Clostridium sp.]|nr:fumarate hydratase [Clostridium sp.]
MKTIDGSIITKEVKRLVMEANFNLPKDVSDALKKSQKNEKWILASDTLGMIIDNANLATSDQVPMCQDTGMVVVFVELGQEVHLTGGNLSVAINEGIRQGYDEGFLRKSVVEDPLRRKNSGDNTP